MAVVDKVQKVTNFFRSMFSKKRSTFYPSSKQSITTVTKNVFIDFIEKYKGVRRTILAIVLWINIHIFFVTIEMYRKTELVDVQWVIFAGYWTAILGMFIAFYTMSRVKEFNSDTSYSRKGEWLSPRASSNVGSTYGATEFTPMDNPSFYDNREYEFEALVGGESESVEDRL